MSKLTKNRVSMKTIINMVAARQTARQPTMSRSLYFKKKLIKVLIKWRKVARATSWRWRQTLCPQTLKYCQLSLTLLLSQWAGTHHLNCLKNSTQTTYRPQHMKSLHFRPRYSPAIRWWSMQPQRQHLSFYPMQQSPTICLNRVFWATWILHTYLRSKRKLLTNINW